ncbi:MAG: lipoprotein [Woeseiaceae bacterium]|nr:lipoprotein [Woeseiaceae bacterium]
MKRIAVALLATFVLAGCGQKGRLFLPGGPNTVQLATPLQENAEADEDRGEDDDDETLITIQN